MIDRDYGVKKHHGQTAGFMGGGGFMVKIRGVVRGKHISIGGRGNQAGRWLRCGNF